jgi:hypothetical protein
VCVTIDRRREGLLGNPIRPDLLPLHHTASCLSSLFLCSESIRPSVSSISRDTGY